MKGWISTWLFLLVLGANTQSAAPTRPREEATAAGDSPIIAVNKPPPSESNAHTAGGGDDGTLPIAIMILAMGRSGSTLMGQLFRHNEVGGWHGYPRI